MISSNIKKFLKKNTIGTLMLSLIIVMMVIGSCATEYRLSLQGHTTSTSTGLKSTWDPPTLDMPIDYFFISGRRANWIIDHTECATSRIDGLGLASWRVQKWSILQRQLKIHDLEFYLKRDLMLKRCLQTRWYPYLPITHSFSNLYRMGWNVQRQNYPIRFRQEGLQEIRLKPRGPRRMHQQDWTQRSTGRTRVIIPTMGRNYNSSSMMNRGNGRGQTTSSITGGLQKRVSVSGRR